jgi:hypothetical protein
MNNLKINFYFLLTDITKMEIGDIRLIIIQIHNQLIHNLLTTTITNKRTHLKSTKLRYKIIPTNTCSISRTKKLIDKSSSNEHNNSRNTVGNRMPQLLPGERRAHVN